MRFTVTPAAGVGLHIGQRRDPPPPFSPLGRIRRRAQDGEITGAATADGQWSFVKVGDGTWMVGHRPTETEVKRGLRDLGACRAYEASGKALTDLERLQSEREENGNGD